ncbi:MAG: hypothetical protein KAI40_10405 [Desulfobacterales bacterium]|nr:hypothetical protein [Desulfobacterales bacterium]
MGKNFYIYLFSVFITIVFSYTAYSSEKPKILFLHHSVGEGLIRDSNIRDILTEAGFEFWDHGYNHSKHGLRDGNGDPAGCYWIPDNNTNPDGFAELFSLNPSSENPLSIILKNYNIILFKSCFPTNKIEPDNLERDKSNPKRRSLYNYKRHYLKIRENVDKYYSKIFIIMTQPPLHPKVTNRRESQRAQKFAQWLKSKEYLNGRRNLFVFDYFNLLADPKTGILKKEYQSDPNEKNSHPNPISNMLIGPKLADFIYNVFHDKQETNLPKISFENPNGNDNIYQLPTPEANISGQVSFNSPLKRLFWSNLKGKGGILYSHNPWYIRNIKVDHGVTKFLVTALSENGYRSSAVVGLQYYSGKPNHAIIFNDSLTRGTLSGLLESDEKPFKGEGHLVIKGNGKMKRAVIGDINLDISYYDPQLSQLEFYYDQGENSIKPKLFIPGIGSLSMDVDDKHGYEKISIPLSRFKYVQDQIKRLILKGNWEKNSNVYLDEIEVICKERNT